MTHHAAVWIDHHEARVLRLAREGTGYYVEVIRAPDQHAQTHLHVGDGHRQSADPRFLAQVIQVMAQCDAVLLCGPAHTKDELLKKLEEHEPNAAQRIVVEPADRMTDGELADHTRRVLARADRMRGVHVGNA